MSRLRGNPWAVLVVVSLGFFMTLLDLTIVNIAIPNIIDRLHASLDDVLWVLNAMVMPIAVVVLAAASCLAIRNRTAAPAGPAGAGAGQMAGTISSPGSLGSSGQSPGSSSGTAS